MPKADVVLEITFDINDSGKTVIKTNAKKEAVEEILEAWLSYQMGKGEDKSKPNIQDTYKIKIQLDLSDDTFFTSSDTGNKSLTCGIIMDVFNRLNQIEVLNFS